MEKFENYRGNKGVLGLYQFIINRIPECSTLVELFAGSGAITKKILAGSLTDTNNCWLLANGKHLSTVLNDCDSGTCAELKKRFRDPTVITNFTAAHFLINLFHDYSSTFVYCDPPYILSTRGSDRQIYKHEMTEDDHAHFLSLVRTADFNCMISHYECEVYDTLLQHWNKEKFKVNYHGNVKDECIYYNYPKPDKLLTYQYVGSDCWDRQRVTRKINRLVKKLNSLPALERNAVIDRVNNQII